MSEVVLSIDDLAVAFPDGRTSMRRVVDGISLELRRGQTLGLVGESGSGKSLTALAALRLIPPPGRIVAGRVLLDGEDLLEKPESALRAVRGGRIAMIFQDPMTSLNPVFTIGEQIAESARLHRGMDRRASQEAAVEALRQVRLPDPERRARQYPHELSGGMRQRAMIAMALVAAPSVLLADEPTTALDVTVQAQILALLEDLRERTGMAALLITHDLGVVAESCDRVAVVYGGQIMESATTRALFTRPRHPYTRGLLASLPEAATAPRRLAFLPGQPPAAGSVGAGCPFRSRCSEALPACAQPLPRIEVGEDHWVRCHRVGAEGGGRC